MFSGFARALLCPNTKLLWCAALQAFEDFDEISDIVKAAAKSDVGNRMLGGKKHISGLLNAVMHDVRHRCLLGE